MKSQLKTHPVADLSGPPDPAKIDSIASDIQARGQLVPIKALEDGRVVEGRHRWLACEKAGLAPWIDIIPNKDGKPPSDEELHALVVSYNFKRNDYSKALRAAAAARAWKMLYPNGNAPGQGRPKKGEINPKNGVNFTAFAKASYDVSKGYAEYALALLNEDSALLDQAATAGSFDAALKEMGRRKDERKKHEAWRAAIQEHEDLADLVSEGRLTLEEAVAAAESRDREAREKEKERTESLAVAKQALENMFSRFGCMNADSLRDYVETIEAPADAIAAIDRVCANLQKIKKHIEK